MQTQGASGDTRLWLHDSAMTEVGFDDDGGSGLFSRIERSCGDPLMPGTYFAKVDEYNGIFEIRNDKAIAAGLTFRALAETARDTLTWSRTAPSDVEWNAGLDSEREAELLRLFAEL